MTVKDADYLAERARQHRAMAEAAADDSARKAHLELANRYQDAIEGIVSPDEPEES